MDYPELIKNLKDDFGRVEELVPIYYQPNLSTAVESRCASEKRLGNL